MNLNFDDLPPIQEIEYDRLRDKIKQDAPKFCQYCDLLDIGEGRGQHGVSVPIPVCEKYPDGFPNNFISCLNLREPCRSCMCNYECHIEDGEPILNEEAMKECIEYQHHKKIRKMDAIAFNKIFCGGSK